MRRIVYINKIDNLTDFVWGEKQVSLKLAKTRNLQGRLSGKMEYLGFDLQDKAVLHTLTLEIVKSYEIEGEVLDLEQLRSSLAQTLSKILQKADFWKVHSMTLLNEHQQKMINRLLDGFSGKLTTSKWGKICKYSHDTALRDIQYLTGKDILHKEASGGRSTNYELKEMPCENSV